MKKIIKDCHPLIGHSTDLNIINFPTDIIRKHLESNLSEFYVISIGSIT
ncbi:hypothetical protein SAMN05444682_10143 [Parapedobacter indicus]|uniref:Uncharacterized protein n=1 Tax=Parapedobacter indicus TaxID=1477437 RepID=A0A1I3CHJ0_9SPHI|nr:hypothetical protein CLV26_10156 [Parapedobacter indicus]SFH74040.1 hypothetical protein SAMN05444682_10143 [Parapedobacter indicus]